MKYLFWSAVFALVLGNSHSARAQAELSVIAPGGARAAMEQLIPDFERKTGLKINATFSSGIETNQKAARGEAFDVAVLQSPYQEVLASGNVISSQRKPLATIALAVAVKQGAPKPDISTPEAVKRMLLAAKSVSCADGRSAAGVSCNDALKKLGIAEQIQPKIKLAPGGPGPMGLVAKGEAEIGITFLSEMNDPGIDVVGPLPRGISTPPALVGFVSSHAKDPAAAKALLDYFSSPEAATVYKAQGMQPGP